MRSTLPYNTILDRAQAWPGMREVARMLGVSASTLSRRKDLEWVGAGQWMRLRPQKVMQLAQEYKKRVLNEVAADLIDYAHGHAPEHEREVTQEVDVFLVEAMVQGRRVRSLAGLDALIKMRAQDREKDKRSAQAQGAWEAAIREAAHQKRQAAMAGLLEAFQQWQAHGYSFGEGHVQMKFERSRASGDFWQGKAALKTDERGKETGYVEIVVRESADPWDKKGHERGGWANEEPTGVLVQSNIYVRQWDGRKGEKAYRPATNYMSYCRMEDLGRLNVVLVELLEAVVDSINPPSAVIAGV
jgi:hypothetical protein